MKKYFFILLAAMLFGISNRVDAQTYNYRAFEFSIKYMNDDGSWTDWSAWQKVNIKVKIDFDDDLIIVQSKRTQVYQVISGGESYTDSSGGQQVKFKVVDQDEDYGTVRLRIEKNGNSQLYVDFSDVMWVYNVRKDNLQ